MAPSVPSMYHVPTSSSTATSARRSFLRSATRRRGHQCRRATWAFRAQTGRLAFTAAGRTSRYPIFPPLVTPARPFRTTIRSTNSSRTSPGRTRRTTIRFGANVSRQIIRHSQPQNASAGNFTINGAATTVAGGPGANAYNAYADFLLGRFSSGLAERLAVRRTGGQDLHLQRIRAGPVDRLTPCHSLLRVRWDYFPVGGRDGRGFARYDPTNNTVKVCGLETFPTIAATTWQVSRFRPLLAFRSS